MPKRQIPKWPFWLGDVLLVGTGLALFFLQEGPISPFAVAWIVIAVGLGAIIACAPYAIEHWLLITKGGGDWADVRNKVVKLEFRMSELEMGAGGAPESARIAQSRYSRFTEDESELGVGDVIKQPKKAEAEVEDKPTKLNFGAKGAALVGAASRDDDAPEASEPDEYDHETPDEDLPTDLDDIGPAEKREPTHLNKALEHARKHQGSDAIKRLIRNGKQ